MAVKPPKRKVQPWQAAGFGTQAAYRASPQFKTPTVKATGPRAGVTFKPTQVKFGAPAPKYQTPGNAQGYRQQSQKYPNAPGMPVEYNPNADTGTVQGAIDAGYMQWTPGLGNLGYKPPPRAPKDITIPGFGGGDLMSGVLGDWEYGAAVGDIDAANRADEVAAGENINALAVGWGGDLSDMVKQGLIDEGAAKAAKENQFSTMANLQRSLEQGGGRLANQLAARGGLDSGALAGGQQEIQRQYQQETQTGLQELMGQIRGIRSSQAQARAGRMADLSGVRANVAARLSQMEQYQPIPKMQAFWDPQRQSYVDDWGRAFDRQGNRLG